MKLNMKLIQILFISLFVQVCFSQKNFKIVNNNISQLEVKFTFKCPEFSYKTWNNKNYLDFSKLFKNISLEKGSPAVPVFAESFFIPLQGDQVLEIMDVSYEEFENVLVLPSKGNLKRNLFQK